MQGYRGDKKSPERLMLEDATLEEKKEICERRDL